MPSPSRVLERKPGRSYGTTADAGLKNPRGPDAFAFMVNERGQVIGSSYANSSPSTNMGSYEGLVTITDNDSTSPQTVSVGGFARCQP